MWSAVGSGNNLTKSLWTLNFNPIQSLMIDIVRRDY